MKLDRKQIMKQWDSWRKYISEGGKASWPRDAFEALLDALDEEKIELIKEWRLKSNRHYNIIPSVAYEKCAGQLEKLVGEVADKSKEEKP